MRGRPLQRGGDLRDRRGVLDRGGPAALVARPVAPPWGAWGRSARAQMSIVRLAHRMTEPIPMRARSLPTPGGKRATVIGAGSFGTALAVVLARGGLRTTLQTRTAEQARALESMREDHAYLPGVELPARLRIESVAAGVARGLRLPGGTLTGVQGVIAGLGAARTGPAGGGEARGRRIATRGGGLDGQGPRPARGVAADEHPQRGVRRAPRRVPGRPGARTGMVIPARGWSRPHDEALTGQLARCSLARAWSASAPTTRSGGTAAPPERGRARGRGDRAQGLNAAGAAAGHIFAEVWRYAEGLRPGRVDDRPGGRG
jgi:glycerol-3-phosphate dehydrogenase (NAD(P)+)